jgi:hypothetical protein
MALLHKPNLNTVVSIEIQDDKGNYLPIATGFLIGFAIDKNLKLEDRRYRIFLVTNRHVFQGHPVAWFRFNKKVSADSARFPLNLIVNGQNIWLAHRDKNVDLAMVTISHDFLNQQNIEWGFFIEEMFAYYNDFDNIGIALGDELYVLGFPMGLAGILRNNPIARHGIIARIDKEIIEQQKAFLIDAFVFPGNSGGPVLSKPTNMGLGGTKAVQNIYLLGVVSGYKPYKEILYSHQTEPPSIASITTENSGLATVVPMDYVKEIYDNWIQSNKLLEKPISSEKSVKEQVVEGGSNIPSSSKHQP